MGELDRWGKTSKQKGGREGERKKVAWGHRVPRNFYFKEVQAVADAEC